MQTSRRERDGLLHLYYGPGKGKTTAAIGSVFRACGHGLSVAIIQFMKGHDEWGHTYGEIEVLRRRSDVKIRQFPTGHTRGVDDLSETERETLLEGLDAASSAISNGEYDLVVLDELTLLDTFDVVETDRIVDLLENRASPVETIVTGRKAAPEIVNLASYVTYMAEVKHPYEQDIEAAPGVEY